MSVGLMCFLISLAGSETQFQTHAKDLAKSFDLSQYDGIVCVSGDGVLAEVNKYRRANFLLSEKVGFWFSCLRTF